VSEADTNTQRQVIEDGVHESKTTLHDFIGSHDKDLAVVGVLVAVATYTATLTRTLVFNEILTLLLVIAAAIVGWQTLTAIPPVRQSTLSLTLFRLFFGAALFILAFYLVMELIKQQKTDRPVVPIALAVACVLALMAIPYWLSRLSHIPTAQRSGRRALSYMSVWPWVTVGAFVALAAVIAFLVWQWNGLYAFLDAMGTALQPPDPSHSTPLTTPTVGPRATATP